MGVDLINPLEIFFQSPLIGETAGPFVAVVP